MAAVALSEQHRLAQPPEHADRAFRKLWIIEDDSQTRGRQGVPGVLRQRRSILIQIHAVARGSSHVAASANCKPGELRGFGRAGRAIELLDMIRARSGIVVAGTGYGTSRGFVSELLDRGMEVALEVPRDSQWTIKGHHSVRADALLDSAVWRPVSVANPETGGLARFCVSELGLVRRDGEELRAFAVAPGSVIDRDGDLRIAVTSLTENAIKHVVQCIGWTRWIRTLNRRQQRADCADDDADLLPSSSTRRQLATGSSRPNIRLSREQDLRLVPEASPKTYGSPRLSGRTLKVMELFAGAGGLGLGFLLSNGIDRRYRIVYSAEVDPIYTQTLRRNHKILKHGSASRLVPTNIEPLDLRTPRAEMVLSEAVKTAGGIDVLIGGPPCQGFSNANRNSWSAKNPNNRLVDVFLRYVRRFQPRIVVLENVQGILWTDRRDAISHFSVADHVVRSLKRSGYWAFPKLLDAVWFGVPQHRARFFLIAIHEDTGYGRDDFGEWGPFPAPTHGPGMNQPYTTVGEAIGDLPVIGNGAGHELLPYVEPSTSDLARNRYLDSMRERAEHGVITDHVTSRHAGYVMERYRHIPQGGNWQDISGLMTNYTAVDRTHSNIYRRLRSDEPAITIGHYRKSMIVHPTQNRGLSLREAARLQSFPDWFRFAGTEDDRPGGLMHKQQQLANAVSPLVAKAVANYLLSL
jgi:DNA-cytosine methyltransferase